MALCSGVIPFSPLTCEISLASTIEKNQDFFSLAPHFHSINMPFLKHMTYFISKFLPFLSVFFSAINFSYPL
jgi:hypothetical protein